MNFDSFMVIFHLWFAVLLILSSSNGLPTGEEKVSGSQPVVLHESVYEAIEEIISRAVNATSSSFEDELTSKYSQLVIEDERKPFQSGDQTESSSARESVSQTSGSPMIAMSPSIREAIILSVRKNLPDFLPAKDDRPMYVPLQSVRQGVSAPQFEGNRTSGGIRGDEKKEWGNSPVKSQCEKKSAETVAPPSGAWTAKSFSEILQTASSPSISEQRNSMTEPNSSSSQQRGSAMIQQASSSSQSRGPVIAGTSSSGRDHFRAAPTRRPKYRMVIVPKVPEANVFDELRHLKINLKSYGAVDIIPLASKSLAVTCFSEEAKKRIENVIMRTGRLEITPRNTNLQYEVRIFIRKNISEDEVRYAVFCAFDEEPSEIKFIPYKGRREEDLKVALLFVSPELFRKMEKNPNLGVGSVRSRIDTEIRIDRCENCQLLGHREKFCASKEKRSFPSPHQKCIDCVLFNRRQQQRHGENTYKLNDTNHRTGADNCPSKKHYQNEYRKARG